MHATLAATIQAKLLVPTHQAILCTAHPLPREIKHIERKGGAD